VDLADRRSLYTVAFLRALATGLIGVLLGIHLARRGFDPSAIGAVVTSGLLGAAVAAVLVTFAGERIGRRRCLVGIALLGAAGGVVVALSSGLATVVAAAFLGMVNGMGRDRGASLILDQAILPATVDDARRTAVFARYNVLQDLGHALGGLAAGAPLLLRNFGDFDEIASLRLAVLAYSAVLLATAAIYAALSPAAAASSGRSPPSSHSTASGAGS